MTFLWPSMLIVLLVIPVIVFLYVRAQRRQRVLSTSFFGSGGPTTARRVPSIRRHLPSALFLVGLTIVLVALARPQAQVTLPRVEGTVILVFDVSGSMGATDVQPSRLKAAQTAAKQFVQSQPSTVRIGVVAFNGSGYTIEQPTNDAKALTSTIDRLQPASGTSLGQGMITALNAIVVDAGLNEGAPPTPVVPAEPQQTGPNAQGASAQAAQLAQLPDGTYTSSTIVLLTDGENNQGLDPVVVAQAAAKHGVRVDALGFGTTAGTTIEVGGFRVHTSLNEAELQQVTQAAGGVYYPAQGEQDPKQVYASLTPKLVVRPETMEITSIFAGASILILLIGSAFSMLWFRRLV